MLLKDAQGKNVLLRTPSDNMYQSIYGNNEVVYLLNWCTSVRLSIANSGKLLLDWRLQKNVWGASDSMTCVNWRHSEFSNVESEWKSLKTGFAKMHLFVLNSAAVYETACNFLWSLWSHCLTAFSSQQGRKQVPVLRRAMWCPLRNRTLLQGKGHFIRLDFPSVQTPIIVVRVDQHEWEALNVHVPVTVFVPPDRTAPPAKLAFGAKLSRSGGWRDYGSSICGMRSAVIPAHKRVHACWRPCSENATTSTVKFVHRPKMPGHSLHWTSCQLWDVWWCSSLCFVLCAPKRYAEQDTRHGNTKDTKTHKHTHTHALARAQGERNILNQLSFGMLARTNLKKSCTGPSFLRYPEVIFRTVPWQRRIFLLQHWASKRRGASKTCGGKYNFNKPWYQNIWLKVDLVLYTGGWFISEVQIVLSLFIPTRWKTRPQSMPEQEYACFSSNIESKIYSYSGQTDTMNDSKRRASTRISIQGCQHHQLIFELKLHVVDKRTDPGRSFCTRNLVGLLLCLVDRTFLNLWGEATPILSLSHKNTFSTAVRAEHMKRPLLV